MPFVKLDCGILNSTLWMARDCREVFITALLMAEPREFDEPMPQIEVRNLEHTGFVVPPGWYGFVPAAGVGIIRQAMIADEQGLQALEKLGMPEVSSRSQEWDGRRLVRVNGGYIVLNYMRYRERDTSAAERMRRYRNRRSKEAKTVTESDAVTRNTVTVTRNVTHSRSRVQSAEVRGEAESLELPLSQDPIPVADTGGALRVTNGSHEPRARAPTRRCPTTWSPSGDDMLKLRAECPAVDMDRELRKFRDNTFGTPRSDWDATWRNWVRRAAEDLGRGSRVNGLTRKPWVAPLTTEQIEDEMRRGLRDENGSKIPGVHPDLVAAKGGG